MEPFFRLNLVLHEGRSELLTVTAAETVDGYPRLREHGGALDTAARACDAVSRLFDTSEPHPGVYNLLCNELALLDSQPDRGGHANQLAFRLKLLLAAGLAPQLAACASCGEREHLSGFSGAAGGVVCPACEAGSFPLAEEAHAFLVDAIGRPLAETPAGRRPRAAPGRAGDRRHARAPRGDSLAPGGGPIGSPAGWRPNGSTSSPRARGTCASCWAARAPTSRR